MKSGIPKIVVPESVGLSGKNLGYIDQVMERAIDENIMKGMVTLVARHGKIAQFKAYGQAREGVPMKKDAIFRLASMTKTISAVALMQLFDRGLVMPSDNLSDYIPAFGNVKVAKPSEDGSIRLTDPEREITIHDLLTMTSGIVSIKSAESGHPGCVYCADCYKKAGIIDTMHPLDQTLEEYIDALSTMPIAAQPGEMWVYSNLSSLVLGRVVEIAAGMDINTYLHRYILDPLGMSETAFFPSPDQYDRVPAVFACKTMNQLDGLDLPGTDDTQLPFAKCQKFHNTAAGLTGTVYDYYKFAQMLLNEGVYHGKRILSKNAISLMSTNHIGSKRTNLYGHAWGYMMEVEVDYNTTFNYMGLGSYGWHGYWGSVYNVWPEKDMLAIMISQTSPVDPTWKIQERFLNVAASAVIDR